MAGNKPINNTSEANQQDRQNVVKMVKRVAAAIVALIWKPMLIIIIVFSIITALTSFIKTIFEVEEETIGGIVQNNVVSTQYMESVRYYRLENSIIKK